MADTKPIGVAYRDQALEGATIDGTVIGGTTPATGTFTSVKAGASSSPVTQASSGSVNQFYVTASHTSGDVRGIYTRVNFTGAGAGDTLRAFSTVAAAQGSGQTTNGAHISLSVNTGGSISGAANAARFTLGSAVNSPGGTLAAIQVDTDFASGVTLPGSAAFVRFTESNNAKMSNLFNVPTAMVQNKTGTNSKVLQIVAADGTPYYIMLATTVS